MELDHLDLSMRLGCRKGDHGLDAQAPCSSSAHDIENSEPFLLTRCIALEHIRIADDG